MKKIISMAFITLLVLIFACSKEESETTDIVSGNYLNHYGTTYPLTKAFVLKFTYEDNSKRFMLNLGGDAMNINDDDLFGSGEGVTVYAMGEFKAGTYTILDDSWAVSDWTPNPNGPGSGNESSLEGGILKVISASNPIEIEITGTDTKVYYKGNATITDESNISNATIPTVETVLVDSIHSGYAVAFGTISSTGGGTITEYGFCWNEQGNATITDSKIITNRSQADFYERISPLNPNTDYYIRAYAINEAGVAYGLEKKITTEQATPILSLDGDWYSSSGLEIRIDGDIAVYLTFNSSYQEVADQGFISLGDTCYRNISKISETEYSYQGLWLHHTNYVWDEKAWSTDGTIILSSDGNSYEASSHSPFTGNLGTAVYYRKQ